MDISTRRRFATHPQCLLAWLISSEICPRNSGIPVSAFSLDQGSTIGTWLCRNSQKFGKDKTFSSGRSSSTLSTIRTLRIRPFNETHPEPSERLLHKRVILALS